MNSAKFRWPLVLAVMVTAGTARAGLVVEQAEPQPVPASYRAMPVASATVLRHIGSFEGEVFRVRGRMSNRSLSQALRGIAPRKWPIYLADPRVETVRTVAFEGANRPWPVVLEEVLAKNQLVATIDWSRRQIVLDTGPGFVDSCR